MRSVNGMLLIVIALFVLWIGITGRFPKLMQAIGVLKDSGEEAPANTASKANSGASKPVVSPPDPMYANVFAWPFMAGYGTYKAMSDVYKGIVGE